MNAAWTLWKWTSTLTSRRLRPQNRRERQPPGRPLPGERRRLKNLNLRTTKRRNLHQGRLPPERRRSQRRKIHHQRNHPQGAVARRKLWYVNSAHRCLPLAQPLQEESEEEDDDIEEIELPKKKGRTAVLRYWLDHILTPTGIDSPSYLSMI